MLLNVKYDICERQRGIKTDTWLNIEQEVRTQGGSPQEVGVVVVRPTEVPTDGERLTASVCSAHISLKSLHDGAFIHRGRCITVYIIRLVSVAIYSSHLYQYCISI